MEVAKKDETRKLVPGNRIRLAAERARVCPPGLDAREPQIILIRDGEAVKAIEVICTCGKRIRMNCVF
jgi:hypothetical protein